MRCAEKQSHDHPHDTVRRAEALECQVLQWRAGDGSKTAECSWVDESSGFAHGGQINEALLDDFFGDDVGATRPNTCEQRVEKRSSIDSRSAGGVLRLTCFKWLPRMSSDTEQYISRFIVM